MKLINEPTGTDSRLNLRNCRSRFYRDVSIAAVIGTRVGITPKTNAIDVPYIRGLLL